METGIKVGDVVKLKSGGLPMTVGVIEATNALCTWFEGNGEHYYGTPQNATVPLVALRKVKVKYKNKGE